jgi:hypothetical protein
MENLTEGFNRRRDAGVRPAMVQHDGGKTRSVHGA